MVTGGQGRRNESDETFLWDEEYDSTKGSIFGHGSARTAWIPIESPQGQKAGVAGDLAPGKIGMDGLVTMEGEGQLW